MGAQALYEFDDTLDALGVDLYLPDERYRGTFSFPKNTTDQGRVPTNNIPPRTGGKKRVRGLRELERKLQPQANPASVFINTVECNENVDPVIPLSVTAFSEGETVPVSIEKTGTGQYTARFSVQDTEVSDEIIGFICDGINAAGSACPFVIGKFVGTL